MSARDAIAHQLPRSFRSEIVQLVIGPHKAVLTIHKDFLTKYEYFRKCLSQNFKEVKENRIELPEEDEMVIAALVEYMVCGKVPIPEMGDTDISWDDFSLQLTEDDHRVCFMACLYVVADKMCMELLQNSLMDNFRVFGRAYYLSPALLEQLEQLLPIRTKMRQYIPAQVAYALVMESGNGIRKKRHNEYAEWCSNGGRLVSDVFKLLAQGRRGDPSLPENNCEWHVHVTTANCNNDKVKHTCRSSSSSDSD